MEFEKEFIEKIQLSEEQLTAINGVVDPYIADLQKSWDGKANENAEGIIGGAGKKVIELTGIQREQGEKWADYLERANGLYFEGTKSSLEQKQKELEEKLKGSKGDELIKQELQETKDLLKSYKQKEADYDELIKGGYKDKFETASKELTTLQRKIAFKNNLPSKPDNVNKYEWDAKLKQFESELLEKNNLVFDENEAAWLVDKENEFKKTKLEDAIKANETIQDLIKGREQKGLGAKPKHVKIDGLPFELPENATSQDRTKAIKDYLASLKLNPVSKEYSEKFAEYNKIALGLAKKPEK